MAKRLLPSNKRAVPLNKIRVAAPCTAEWRFMYGTDRVRFCGLCSQNVYNLSAMTRQEAEDLIRRTEGQLCVRFYRRWDGTILTRNCPVGMRAIKDRLKRASAAIITAVLSFLIYIGAVRWYAGNDSELGVFHTIIAPAYPCRPAVMGAIIPASDSRQAVARSEAFIRERAAFRATPAPNPAGPGREKATVVVKVTVAEDGEVDEAVAIGGPAPQRELAEEAAYRRDSSH